MFDFMKATSIEILRKWEADSECFSKGALVKVHRGKAALKEVLEIDKENNCSLNLVMNGKNLMEFHGDEYFCPTCEKLVRTAYTMDKAEELNVSFLNEEFTFDQALEQMKPFLGILEDGYYCIWDTALYPTDGNNNLFCEYTNNKYLRGSCVVYTRDYYWGDNIPYFMIATQSKRNFDLERIDYYRKNGTGRAIAYYIDGNITALLDGHHKALAAAIEHRKCNALVISKCQFCMKNEDGKMKDYLYANGVYFSCEELGIEVKKNNNKETKNAISFNAISAKEMEDEYPFDIDTNGLVNYYPTAEEQVYISKFGTIGDELIDDYLNGKIVYDESKLCEFFEALSGLKHNRLFEILDYTWYVKHDLCGVELLGCIAEKMLKLPRTELVEKWLIQFVVEVEENHPEVARLVMSSL